MAGNSINEILETDGGGKGGIIRIDHGKKLQQQRNAAARRTRMTTRLRAPRTQVNRVLNRVNSGISSVRDGANNLLGRSGGSATAQANVMSPAEAARTVVNAPRTSTAATHTDTFHTAGGFLTESQLAQGHTSIPHSADGILRTKLQVPGKVNGKGGVFEFIIEPDGSVSHQLFRPN